MNVANLSSPFKNYGFLSTLANKYSRLEPEITKGKKKGWKPDFLHNFEVYRTIPTATV